MGQIYHISILGQVNKLDEVNMRRAGLDTEYGQSKLGNGYYITAVNSTLTTYAMNSSLFLVQVAPLCIPYSSRHQQIARPFTMVILVYTPFFSVIRIISSIDSKFQGIYLSKPQRIIHHTILFDQGSSYSINTFFDYRLGLMDVDLHI